MKTLSEMTDEQLMAEVEAQKRRGHYDHNCRLAEALARRLRAVLAEREQSDKALLSMARIAVNTGVNLGRDYEEHCQAIDAARSRIGDK